MRGSHRDTEAASCCRALHPRQVLNLDLILSAGRSTSRGGAASRARLCVYVPLWPLLFFLPRRLCVGVRLGRTHDGGARRVTWRDHARRDQAMTERAIIEFWRREKVKLLRWPPRALADVAIPAAAKRFLQRVGLPRYEGGWEMRFHVHAV
jgi:hypothetical protein